MARGAIRIAAASDVTSRMPRSRESSSIATADARDILDLDFSRLPYDDRPSGHRPAVDPKTRLDHALLGLSVVSSDGQLHMRQESTVSEHASGPSGPTTGGKIGITRSILNVGV